MSVPRSICLIFLLWVAGLGAAAQFAKLAVPFDLVSAQYPAAGAGIGWLLTLISAIGAVLGMTAGVLVARFGCARVLILSLLLGAAISLWQATRPELPVMMATRLLEGVSHLAIVVAAPTLIAQISPDGLRNWAMTLWSTFFGVSFALMAWLGGPFVASHGLSGLFNLHGVFLLGLAGVLAIVMTGSGGAMPKADTAWNLALIARQHVRSYGSPFIAAPAMGWLLYTLTFVSLLATLPALLPAENRASVASLMPLSGIAVSLILVPALLTRLSAVTVIVLGFGCAIGTIGLFFLGLAVPYVCIGLFGILGLIQGASFAAVPQLNAGQEERALANGAMAQMGNLGNLLGTPLLLWILGLVGLSGLLITVAGVYGIGGLTHLIMARRRKTADATV
ncbi:MAG: MFS transporter [Inquilinaceae bacterium]